RILMIEDDAHLASMVQEYLSANGFEVAVAPRAQRGLAMLDGGSFQAVLLDVMLPDLDGFETCRRIRARGDTPVLMLTARADATAPTAGREAGAADSLPTPSTPRGLRPRLRAALRRRAAPDRRKVLRFGRLEIAREARRVRLDGRERPLTSHQFD